MKKRFFALITVIFAVAVIFNACADNSKETPVATATDSVAEAKELGEGATKFEFEVIDLDGNTEKFIINTDKTIVGEALEELGLIKGTEGDYGIYVNEVNGILADYNINQTYWAFYINDAYASTGADVTPIAENEVYSFRAEKG